ncbi:MAG: nicotinate-nucleotide--dimethylbenzimidazole phosphoribosyltransferase [Pseudomonadota bacterium]
MRDALAGSDFETALRRKIDGKTKPLGALGRVESLAAQIARARQSLEPQLESCCLTIFAADHGVATAGVSAYPQEVTRQMVLNFLSGGAAANVFARSAGVSLRVVDAGVAGPPLGAEGLIERRIGAGTASFLSGPAMSPRQLDQALEAGRALGTQEAWDAVAFGEMGIGNTSSAALVAHKLTDLALDHLVGRGTGLDDAGVSRKHDILARAADRTARHLSPLNALEEYGGFEMAMMAGAMISAAEAGRVVIVDGFIATAAAMIALRETTALPDAFVFAHVSAESGHAPLLYDLGREAVLDLDMRLGEGTGALLAWPILKAAAAMLRDMASFDSAGVSGPA